MSKETRIRIDQLSELAENQAKATERMLEINQGIGGLAVYEPHLAESMSLWDEASENEHADTVLELTHMLHSVLAIPRPTEPTNEFARGYLEALNHVSAAIDSGLRNGGDGHLGQESQEIDTWHDGGGFLPLVRIGSAPTGWLTMDQLRPVEAAPDEG